MTPFVDSRSDGSGERPLLGLRLGPWPSPDLVHGWRIAGKGDDWLRLETASWLMTCHVVVHVESAGGEIVIVEGRAEEISDDAALRPVWDAYKQKYNWDASGYPFYAVKPAVAFSFEEQLGETATRWTFAP